MQTKALLSRTLMGLGSPLPWNELTIERRRKLTMQVVPNVRQVVDGVTLNLSAEETAVLLGLVKSGKKRLTVMLRCDPLMIGRQHCDQMKLARELEEAIKSSLKGE